MAHIAQACEAHPSTVRSAGGSYLTADLDGFPVLRFHCALFRSQIDSASPSRYCYAARSYEICLLNSHLAFGYRYGFLTLTYSQGPTVFPILFACILSRATHAILVWRLERGESVGTLDLLAGSTSLTSTVTSQLQLRTFGILGPALVVIWALSPIGGQAALRVMTVGAHIRQAQIPLQYMLFDGAPGLSDFDGSGSALQYDISTAEWEAALFSTAAAYSASTDLWGNVKIPYFEDVEMMSNPNSDGWYTTNLSNGLYYSSLVGVPVAGIESASTVSNFSMETSYFNVECGYNSTEVTRLDTLGGRNWAAGMTPGGVLSNGTKLFDGVSPFTNLSYMVEQEFSTNNFTYTDAFGAYECNLTRTYVEVGISCGNSSLSNSSCGTTMMRRSQINHPPEIYNWSGTWYYFTRMLSIFASPDAGTSPNPYNTYFIHPGNVTSGVDTMPSPTLTGAEFSKLFLRVLNTWWMILLGPYAITGSVSVGSVFVYNSSTENSYFEGYSNTTGTQTTTTEVIICHHNWLIALCIASILLILATAVRPILQFFAHGPDVLLNFSSLATRSNEYIPLPPSGTAMDASDRARSLKDLKVRFGDIRSQDAIGRLVIGLDIPGAPSIGSARKRRLYE